MPEAFYVEQDGVIVIHTFTESSEAAIDAWEMAVIDLIERTPPDQLFRLLVDVSAPQVSFTRRARQASMSLFTHYRHRRGQLAFLFSSKTAPHFARIFFASLGKLTFEHQYFSNREHALNWLRDTESH